jgi:hypothetical protein
MKVLARSRYGGAPPTAQDGLDPIASGLPQMAIRGRPFLSEHADDNRLRYYKDGQQGAIVILCGSPKAAHPSRPSSFTSPA